MRGRARNVRCRFKTAGSSGCSGWRIGTFRLRHYAGRCADCPAAFSGAGTGAAIGSLSGAAGTGALIGGLGGMAIGALTSPDALNLGDPPWHHTAYRHHHYSHTAVHSGNCTTRETDTERRDDLQE